MDHVGRANRDTAKREAAGWVLRLAAGNLDDAERRRFEAWLNASPDHRVLFEWESLVWEKTERLQALRPADQTVDPQLLTRLVTGEPAGMEPRPWWRRYGRQAAAVAATVLVACGAALLHFSSGRNQEAAVYATAVGERRSIDLPDGSRLELNTNTEVAVTMSPAERHVLLVRGESLFDVQPDASRPFKVTVGNSTVRAVGTAFNIRRDREATRILVTEGEVEVVGVTGPRRTPFSVRLPAGSIGIEDAQSMVSRMIAQGELERALSWRFGAIILAGETLSQAAAEFNRYNIAQITVADPAIAGLRLGGYFNARDVDSFVEVLASTYALDVAVEGEAITLRGTAGTASKVRDNGMAIRSM